MLLTVLALIAMSTAPAATESPVVLADGSVFTFWDDSTAYSKTYHVAKDHPAADDRGPGSADRPFATISAAAAVLQPGEEAVIHAGTYREWVRPARGGSGPSAMIRYRAAPGEIVIISASEIVTPQQRTVTSKPDAEHERWEVSLPETWFAGYDPFAATNFGPGGWFPFWSAGEDERNRVLAPRGVISLNGQRLVHNPRSSDTTAKPWYSVQDRSRKISVLLDGKLGDRVVEAWVREQCFAPVVPGLGYIRVAGLICEHAANGIPQPHRGALGTGGGHHWILEDNTIRQVNTVGIDIGGGWPKGTDASGGHIVRRNRLQDLGTAGVFGTNGVSNSLIEDNLFERIGTLGAERCFEAAAIKFHFARNTVIRRNLIRHVRSACGVWLDYQCANCRVTRNAMLDIETLLAAVYIEANPEGNLVDGNVVWDMRDPPGNTPPKDGFSGGNGISSDISESTGIAHNLIGKVGHYAIAHHIAQKNRLVDGHTALCTGAVIQGNIALTGKLIYLARRNDNQCDRNLYAGKGQGGFCLEEPGREALVNLDFWQRLVGFDKGAVTAPLTITCDVDAATITLKLKEPQQVSAAQATNAAALGYDAPGPIPAAVWAKLNAGESVTLNLPLR
ncbi:hypothetical protein LBMAG53_29100 [Planctomycetota bacterium]|nr:hypothetical protein LBMAG53_29100 [Planctomycetota bacterium]